MKFATIFELGSTNSFKQQKTDKKKKHPQTKILVTTSVTCGFSENYEELVWIKKPCSQFVL